jgi:hypothetical protein
LASSIPATSLNVTVCWPASTRRARLRPKLPSAPAGPAAAARRPSHTNSATSRITGPKPRIRLRNVPRPALIGSASIVTSCSLSSVNTVSVLAAKLGISVSKLLAVFEFFLPLGG